jgi:hypothetical protein
MFVATLSNGTVRLLVDLVDKEFPVRGCLAIADKPHHTGEAERSTVGCGLLWQSVRRVQTVSVRLSLFVSPLIFCDCQESKDVP